MVGSEAQPGQPPGTSSAGQHVPSSSTSSHVGDGSAVGSNVSVALLPQRSIPVT